MTLTCQFEYRLQGLNYLPDKMLISDKCQLPKHNRNIQGEIQKMQLYRSSKQKSRNLKHSTDQFQRKQ